VLGKRHAKANRTAGAIWCLALLPIAGCGGTESSQLAGPEGVRCLAEITGAPTSVPAAASQATVVVTMARECSWTARSNATWLTVDPAAGQGETTLNLSIATNTTSSSRSASLSVNEARVTVTQAANSSQPPSTGVTFTGSVSNLSGACPVLVFNVAGRQVVTDADTRFTGGNCASLRNGRSVEIDGEELSATLVRAIRVRQ
jgi:hypothetical protein